MCVFGLVPDFAVEATGAIRTNRLSNNLLVVATQLSLCDSHL